ncbi:trypsin Inhibitor like cysteine rich domain protein [Cooperia oncophora]
MCTMQCLVNVCQCKDGFFRNSQNRCVSNCSESEEICGVNEELKRCGTACEPTCDQPIRSCTKDCVLNVCQCKEGFLRDANNTCVPEQECPRNITCGLNEEVKKCGTACEPTCADPIPKCTKQCVGPVCQCRDGFIRDSSGTCIREESCPLSTFFLLSSFSFFVEGRTPFSLTRPSRQKAPRCERKSEVVPFDIENVNCFEKRSAQTDRLPIFGSKLSTIFCKFSENNT